MAAHREANGRIVIFVVRVPCDLLCKPTLKLWMNFSVVLVTQNLPFKQYLNFILLNNILLQSLFPLGFRKVIVFVSLLLHIATLSENQTEQLKTTLKTITS